MTLPGTSTCSEAHTSKNGTLKELAKIVIPLPLAASFSSAPELLFGPILGVPPESSWPPFSCHHVRRRLGKTLSLRAVARQAYGVESKASGVCRSKEVAFKTVPTKYFSLRRGYACGSILACKQKPYKARRNGGATPKRR
jgi:hypothetical protein